MGEGKLLYNPTPGVDFQTGDLVRNLLLSRHMDSSLAEQEKVLWDYWLKPLEIPFKEKLKDILREFIAKIVSSQGKNRPISNFEKFVITASKTIDVREMLIYAHFVSYVEACNGNVEAILSDLIAFSKEV